MELVSTTIAVLSLPVLYIFARNYIKSMQRQYKDKKELLNMIIQNSPMAMCLLNTEFDYITVNDSWSYNICQGDCDINHLKLFPHHADMKENTSIKILETLKNGKKEWIEWKKIPWYIRNGHNKLGGYIIFSEIKTDEVNMDAELRIKNLAIESAAEGIIITKGDEDHEIIYCNKAYQHITGYSKEEVIGKNPRFLQGPETNKETKAQIREAILNNKNIEVEILNYNKHNKPFWCKASISPIYNDQGDVINFLGIMEDITSDVYLKNKLEESNKNLEEFAYIVSHDLKSPLRTIRVMADCLNEDNLNPENNEYLERIHSSAQRMREMIDSLLIFSRATRCNQPYEEIDIVEIVTHALSDLQAENILKLNILSSFPNIWGNKTQIRSVFQNLFENSIKFCPNKEPIVELSYDKDYDYHIINYKDNGMGFDMKYKDEVFKPFRQIYPEYDGIGMGMAICKKIIEKHKGIIDVSSEIGVGTNFQIKLPIGV